MLATPQDVRRFHPTAGEVLDDLERAERWVTDRVELNGHVPDAVTEATALLAAVFHVEPEAPSQEALVPNMVRLMILPWMRGR